MRLGLQIQRLAISVTWLAIFATFTAASAVLAQEAPVLEHLLRDARDYRVRARAAAALGRRPSSSAVVALTNALADKHPAVRVAAAIALGQLAEAEALPALRKCARDPHVAKHARESIARIELELRRRGVIPEPARQIRYGLWIGELRDRSPAPEAGLLPVLANSLDVELRAIEGVQLVDIQGPADGVPVYRVDGQITDTDRALLPDKVTARASVALLLTDDASKTLRIVFRGSSTTIEDLDRKAFAQPERVARLAIERAVRAALRNASNAMHEALAKR